MNDYLMNARIDNPTMPGGAPMGGGMPGMPGGGGGTNMNPFASLDPRAIQANPAGFGNWLNAAQQSGQFGSPGGNPFGGFNPKMQGILQARMGRGQMGGGGMGGGMNDLMNARIDNPTMPSGAPMGGGGMGQMQTQYNQAMGGMGGLQRGLQNMGGAPGQAGMAGQMARQMGTATPQPPAGTL